MLLLIYFNWFGSLLIPLLQSVAHQVVAQTLHRADEVLKGCVALVIKTTVVEELVHRGLLALGDHGLE